MPTMTAQLFGDFELKSSTGEQLELKARKTRALLAVLILEDARWLSRDWLAGLLWGDRPDARARSSLSQALYEIRKLEAALGVTIVEREAERLRLAKDSVESDIRAFRTALMANIPEAANYRPHELLDGIDLRDQGFADWLLSKRTEYHEKLSDALRGLASSSGETQPSETALQAARDLVRLNPTDEIARRHLMALLAEAGDRAEALRHYEMCREMLNAELGVEPDAATQELYLRIRATNAQAMPDIFNESDVRHDLIDTSTDGDRPVVAVMPFANLDDDPAFAFMVDGLVEDITMALSAFRSFRVLAFAATSRLRDADLDHAGIRRALGAAYAVRGRVRRSGTGRLRIGVELLDCRTGEQVWSNQYNSEIGNVFEVEETISWSIAAAIEPSLEAFEIRRVLGRPPETLEAYESLLRGYWHLYRRTPQDLAAAWRFMEAAISKDPTYAAAYAGLAFLGYHKASTSIAGDDYIDLMKGSLSAAEQALTLDPLNPRAMTYCAQANNRLGNHDTTLETVQRAVALCPSFYQSHTALAFACDFLGKFSEAKCAADETIRLRPRDPLMYKCIISKSIAEYQTGDYDRAAHIARVSMLTDGSWWNSRMLLAASLAKAGQESEARVVADNLRRDHPGLTLETMLRRMPFARAQHTEHLADGLVQAGWRD